MAVYLEVPPGAVYWHAEKRVMIRPAVYVWRYADNVARFDSYGHALSVVEDLNAYERATAEPGEVPTIYRVAVATAPREDEK